MTLIHYTFNFSKRESIKITVDTDRNFGNSKLTTENEEPMSSWTNIDFYQCPNCPLSLTEHKKCPTAVDLHFTLTQFKNVLSTEETDAIVETSERIYKKNTDTQTALRSLIGVIMATSLCPILKQMRGMANFHLPFATLDETIFRAISSYFIKQYFKQKEGKKPDWDLIEFPNTYEEINIVNQSFFSRIKHASQADANLNSIVIFSSMSSLFSLSLDDFLSQFEPYFSESENSK